MARERKITEVAYNPSGKSTTGALWQYDYGQKLHFSGFNLPDPFEVHFSNYSGYYGAANVSIGTNDMVDIPDVNLLPGSAIHAWLYDRGDSESGNTMYEIVIPVTKRPKISGVVPPPDDPESFAGSSLFYENGDYLADSLIGRYQLLFHIDEDTLTPLNNDNDVLDTTKTMLTNVSFNPSNDIYFYDSELTVQEGDVVSATSCFYCHGEVDLRYTFNIAEDTLNPNKDVYLQLMFDPLTGLYHLANENPLTQALPETEDGLFYLRLGRAYDGCHISLRVKKPIFYHNGEKIMENVKWG